MTLPKRRALLGKCRCGPQRQPCGASIRYRWRRAVPGWARSPSTSACRTSKRQTRV